MNPNYRTIVKSDLDKKTTRYGTNKEATWLSPIVVIPKKNENLMNMCEILDGDL